MSTLPIAYSHVAEKLGALVEEGSGAWVGVCPSHEDGTPSLWIKQGDRGLVVKCRAGCATADVLKSLGLTFSDLYPKDPMSDPKRRGRVVKTYTYTDAAGAMLFQVCRTDPKGFFQRRRPVEGDDPAKIKDSPAGPWVYSRDGIGRVLYRLPNVLKARAVILCEGEKDADRVAKLRLDGIVATTIPEGAGKWKLGIGKTGTNAYTEALRGKRVAILPDNDEPGRHHAVDVFLDLTKAGIRAAIVELPGLPPKGDVSDWLDAGGTGKALVDLIAAAFAEPQAVGTTPPASVTTSAAERTTNEVADELPPADVLSLVAVALAGGPDSPRAAARLVADLRSRGVLA